LSTTGPGTGQYDERSSTVTKTPRDLAQRAVGIVAAPAGKAGFVVGLAKGAASTGVTVAGAVVRTAWHVVRRDHHEPPTTPAFADEPVPATGVGADSVAADDSPVFNHQPAPATPGVPDLEPLPAAEQLPPEPPGESFAHEPKAPSVESARGESSREPEPAEDWAAEAEPVTELGVENPVGTTGADVGSNPDTAEADLQQPDTEPLLDPSLTKQVKSEAQTLGKAADVEKE
jgi:hypothetical protein